MTVREYIGARYVPLIMGNWDNTVEYEPLSIVMYQGNSFTSRQYVPTGIDITNEQFWAPTGNYNAQIEYYRQEVASYDERITDVEDLFNAPGWVDSTKLADGAVTTAKIADGAITEVKIADGAVTEDKIDDGAITSDKIGANTINTINIVDGAITENKLANDSVSEDKIADGAITSEKIGQDVINTINIVDEAVTEDKIADGAITSEKIGANTINTVNIIDDAITEDKIVDGAVTADKIDSSYTDLIEGLIAQHKGITDMTSVMTLIRVNGTSGNDSTGDGTLEHPFKTVDAALDYAGNNNMRYFEIRIMANGTYNCTKTRLNNATIHWDVDQANANVTINFTSNISMYNVYHNFSSSSNASFTIMFSGTIHQDLGALYATDNVNISFRNTTSFYHANVYIRNAKFTTTNTIDIWMCNCFFTGFTLNGPSETLLMNFHACVVAFEGNFKIKLSANSTSNIIRGDECFIGLAATISNDGSYTTSGALFFILRSALIATPTSYNGATNVATNSVGGASSIYYHGSNNKDLTSV